MLSKHSNPARVRVELNGTDVTSSFAVRADGRFVGLVSPHRRQTDHPRFARAQGADHADEPRDRRTGLQRAAAGPVLLPDAAVRARTVDRRAVRTVVSYRYRTLTGAFQAYDGECSPANQIAKTTDQGVTVPYIVRVERGTMNRGIYELAVLTDPAMPWAPWASQASWNHKVYWLVGGGTAPWRAGRSSSAVVDMALSRGSSSRTRRSTSAARTPTTGSPASR